MPASLPWRARFARASLQLVSAAARVRGSSGTVIGAQVALRIDPSLVSHLARGKTLVTVSATNGKTTTTSLLRAALATRGPVVSNETGSNLATGVATALARSHAEVGALEVDEAALVGLLPQLRPAVVVLGNLSRDQLDRYGEVRMVAQRWRHMLDGFTGTVVANSQDPLVSWAAAESPHVVWVAPGLRWRADANSCPACGNPIVWGETWACSSCTLREPRAEWSLQHTTVDGPDGFSAPLSLTLPGEFNRGNAVLAAAAAHVIGIDPAAALRAMATVQDVAGRFAEVYLGGGATRLMLAKNPAGWTELLGIAVEASADLPMIVSINARVADGHDTSWLWDVPFETLAGHDVYATGDRRYDIALRLKYAGVRSVTVVESAHDARSAITQAGTRPDALVTFIGNYTAFADVAKQTAAI